MAAELTRHRLSHAQLGAAVNMSETQIGRRVRGEVEFSATEIRAIAVALGVPVDALLADTSAFDLRPTKAADPDPAP